MDQNWREIEDNESIKKDFADYLYGLMRHEETGLVLPPKGAASVPLYQVYIFSTKAVRNNHSFKNMKARKSDIWVVTYPKCGTTWTQEMVWQIANNVDLVGGKKMLEERFPYLEAETLWEPKSLGAKGKLFDAMFSIAGWMSSFSIRKPSSWFGYKNMVKNLEDVDEEKTRFIKTHLPFSFLPRNLVQTSKVIYVARNPKDAMIR